MIKRVRKITENTLVEYMMQNMATVQIDNLDDIFNVKLSCPHCHESLRFTGIGRAEGLHGFAYNGKKHGLFSLVHLHCIFCENSIIYARTKMGGECGKYRLIFPYEYTVDMDLSEIDPIVAKGYEESVKCLVHSPNATAMLLRRLLAYILVDKYNADRTASLYDMIQSIEQGAFDPKNFLSDKLEYIRKIGNLGAHGEIKSCEELIDVEVAACEPALVAMKVLITHLYIHPLQLEKQKNNLNNISK